jgi:hypothetical protein
MRKAECMNRQKTFALAAIFGLLTTQCTLATTATPPPAEEKIVLGAVLSSYWQNEHPDAEALVGAEGRDGLIGTLWTRGEA